MPGTERSVTEVADLDRRTAWGVDALGTRTGARQRREGIAVTRERGAERGDDREPVVTGLAKRAVDADAHGIDQIMSFDAGFDGYPGVTRIR